MRWNKIFLTIKKELRAIVRDKKSFMQILAMPFIIPFMVFLMGFLYDFMMNEEQFKYTIGTNYELNSNEEGIVSELGLDVIVYKSKEEMDKAYEDGEIVAYINLENNMYFISSNLNDADSATAGSYIEAYLSSYNNFLAENYLMSEDIEPSEVFNIINYEIIELEGDNFLVEMISDMALPYVIVVIVLVAATCTTDLTAGEKERGTLETLLTFPVKSSEIVMGKFLGITSMAFFSGVFSFVLALASLGISTHLFDCFEGYAFSIGVDKVIMAVVIICAVSLIVSGLSIAIGSKAKSFKEAQSALQPIQFLGMIPLFLPMFEVENSLIISIIPLVGQGMLLNELFSMGVNYLYVISSFISSIIFIVLVIAIISKQYKSEKVLFF
ncbi:MAG: ABC transporter permease [Firmicutes bacterium]|nr:ABC transporter permease [Bacillota bacterium]